MQRLFSVFPNGWPGRGLLLQRVVTAVFLFYFGFEHLNEDPRFALIVPHAIGTCAGIFLLLGLWTPVCGTVAAAAELWIAVFCIGDRGLAILLAVWGANDQIFGPAGAEAFARDLPDARIHLLDAGHFALESEIDNIAELAREFLARTLRN